MRKSKAMNYIVKKILSHYKRSCLSLLHVKAIKTYSVNCKKNAVDKNSSIRTTKQNRLILVKLCCLWQEKLLKLRSLNCI